MYCRILIDRVRKITDGMIGDEQLGFRLETGSLTGSSKDCKVYAGFMDLVKAYNRVVREALGEVL